MKKVRVGDHTPDVTWTAPTSEQVRLNDLTNQSKVVVLFSKAWRPTCSSTSSWRTTSCFLGRSIWKDIPVGTDNKGMSEPPTRPQPRRHWPNSDPFLSRPAVCTRSYHETRLNNKGQDMKTMTTTRS